MKASNELYNAYLNKAKHFEQAIDLYIKNAIENKDKPKVSQGIIMFNIGYALSIHNNHELARKCEEENLNDKHMLTLYRKLFKEIGQYNELKKLKVSQIEI